MKRFLLLSAIVFTVTLTMYAQNFDSIKIFLYDGDRGKTFANPDNTQQTIGYEYNYIKALGQLGFSESNGNLVVSNYLPSTESQYMEYAAIFMIMGNGDPSKVTITDIVKLTAYLEAGGCLLIEGNNVPSYLQSLDSTFIMTYFNNKCLSDGGTGYSGYDTLVSDTTDTSDPFYRLYKFVYPAGTAPDSSVDVIGPKFSFLKINYRSTINYSDQSKLYKSTGSAYTPPETKQFFAGKTVMQSVAFGAFADPHSIPNSLPDSLDNQYARLSYLKDILAFFGIGRTLLVKDDMNALNTSDTISSALSNLGIEFTKISVGPGADGPSYSELMKYTYVIWYTGGADSTTTLKDNDTLNLSVYLTYGGNFILSGENIAQDIGVQGVNTNILAENRFLSLRLRVDYISSDVDKNVYYANPDGFFYGHSAARTCSLYTLTPLSKVDYILPYLRGTHVDTTYYFSTTKANNCVGISHQGIMQRSIFFGFCIEKLYLSDITSILSTAFQQYFTSNLGFEPLRGSVLNREISAKKPQNSSVSSANVHYSSGILFVNGIQNALLLDRSGRIAMHLESGKNEMNRDIQSGVYFVRGLSQGLPYIKSIIIMR